MRINTALAALVTLVLPVAAAAQTQTPAAVTVLLPDTFQVGTDVAQALYSALVDAVNADPAYEMGELPPQTMTDVLLAVGCSEPNPDCLSTLSDIVGTPYMIWGRVSGTASAYLVELTFWDFSAGAAHYQLTKAVEGSLDDFEGLFPVFSRGLVYGPVGHLEIDVDPADATVEFDSHPTDATRPVVLEHLDLGPHVVRVTHDGYFEDRETVVVDLEPATLNVQLVPTTERVTVRGGKLWTWVALGAGVAFTGAGVAFALLEQSTQDTYDTDASRLQVDTAQLQDLQNTGDTQALLSNVFFAVGGAALVASVVLFFVEKEEQAPPPSAGSAVSVRPVFGAGGYGVSLGIDF